MSSNSEDSDPPPQNDQPLFMVKTIESLNILFTRLSEAANRGMKEAANRGMKEASTSPAANGDSKSNVSTSDKHELDEACKELKSLIEEIKELQNFETELSKPLITLQQTIDDVLKDLNTENKKWDHNNLKYKIIEVKTKLNSRKVPMAKVIESLRLVYKNLLDAAKIMTDKASKLSPPAPAARDGKSEDEKSKSFALDKACNELKYLIDEFDKLGRYETLLSEPLDTIQDNVDDILGYLNENPDNVEWDTINDNLKVLRSNMTKVKAQLPLLHETSSNAEARRFLTTTSREEASKLPSPYEAKGIFEKGSFLKEFQDRYIKLGKREKLCLLCFAIFPENAEVSERLLRFWWEAERLRPASESDTTTVNQILEEFVKRGFIEPVYRRSGSKGSCYKMHPIVRCLIVRLAEKANFFYYDSKGYPDMEFFKSKKICLVKSEGPSWWSKDIFAVTRARERARAQAQPQAQAEQGKDKKQAEAEAETITKEKKKQKQQLEEQRLKDEEKRIAENKKRITEDKERRKQEAERIKYLENLQTLFNVSKQFPELPEELFPKMKNIGVLYLGRWERTAERHMEVEDVKFLTGLKNMIKLRFFSLQGISGIKKLPNSIGMLQNLRILDLRACHTLEELPKEVGLLKMLSYLDLSQCYLLDKIPKDLSKLSKLKVLKGFVISSNSPCSLTDLTMLSELEKLSISIHDDKFSIKKGNSIMVKFKSLTKFRIAWGAGGTKKTHDKAKPAEDKNKNKNKTKTKTKKCFKLPLSKCSKSPPEKGDAGSQSELKLEKLDIRCYPDKEPPEWLVPNTLTHLKRLYFRGGELSHIPVAVGDKKWKVKTLRLKYLTNIKMDWKQLRKQFPELNLLEKVNCPQITFCPCDASGAWEEK